MAELSRFHFAEMMNVIRDAVRSRKDPLNYLNGAEVSAYIKNRYSPPEQQQDQTTKENRDLRRTNSLPRSEDIEDLAPPDQSQRAHSAPRQSFSQRRSVEPTKMTSNSCQVLVRPSKTQSFANRGTPLRENQVKANMFYSPVENTSLREEIYKEQLFRAQTEPKTAPKTTQLSTTKAPHHHQRRRRQEPPKTKLATLGMKKSEDNEFPEVPNVRKHRSEKRSDGGAGRKQAPSVGPIRLREGVVPKAKVAHAFHSRRMFSKIRAREALAKVEQDYKLTEQKKQLTVLMKLADETLRTARNEQRKLEAERRVNNMRYYV